MFLSVSKMFHTDDLDSKSSTSDISRVPLLREGQHGKGEPHRFCVVGIASGRALYIDKTKKNDHVWIYLKEGQL